MKHHEMIWAGGIGEPNTIQLDLCGNVFGFDHLRGCGRWNAVGLPDVRSHRKYRKLLWKVRIQSTIRRSGSADCHSDTGTAGDIWTLSSDSRWH